MSVRTGLSIVLWASAAELQNAKNGGSMLIASKAKTKDADIQVTVSLEACDVLENEVRVNLELVQKNIDAAATQMGETMGAAMGAELQKAFAAME